MAQLLCKEREVGSVLSKGWVLERKRVTERMAGFSVRSEHAVSEKGAGELELCRQHPEGMAPAWHGVPCSAMQASALWDGLSLCSKETVPGDQGSCGPAASSGVCWIRSCPLALCEAPNVFCIVSFRSLKC